MRGIAVPFMNDRRQAKVQECSGHQGKGKEAGQHRQTSKSSLLTSHERSLPWEIKLKTSAASYSTADSLMQTLSQ
jgi:hypothetical protein